MMRVSAVYRKKKCLSHPINGVSGSITLDNDFAVVQFEQIGYFENSKVTTYLFHKTSDDPNIDEQLN